MDPIKNPFSPGAGTPPPELAGRDADIRRAEIAIARIKNGRHAKSEILVGLRGVGKTVLLNRFRQIAEKTGTVSVRLEAPETRSLPALLVPGLHKAMLELDRRQAATKLLQQAQNFLADFIRSMKVKHADVEVSLDIGNATGESTGDLEADISELLKRTGEAAKERETSLLIFIDELHYVKKDEFASLIAALHLCSQFELSVALFGAGLPQIKGLSGKAKSYAERLFDFSEIGALTESAAEQALKVPIENEGATIAPDALSKIVSLTEGYPFFLQVWGGHAWDSADSAPITLSDVLHANKLAITDLDSSFFRVRFDRLTPGEKHYLRAMSELGPGPHRSGDVATVLSKAVNAVAPVRSNLIHKGMIYSPSHGDTAFTVPLFDGFMKRIMPQLNQDD
ncbi:MAG: ATP-binding protein [Pseudomonadota bacterium]